MAIAALIVFSGCGSKTGTSQSGSATPGTGGGKTPDPVDVMFLNNRSQLQSPEDRLKSSLDVSLAGFTTPIGGGGNSITVDLTLSQKAGGPDLEILAVIPYQVGDVEKGPGAHFKPVSNKSLLLSPGTSQPVSIDLIRERVGQGAPPIGGGSPATGLPPQVGVQPVAPGGPGRATTKNLAPQIGPVQPSAPPAGASQAGSPFDTAKGLQILVVMQFVDSAPPDLWRNVVVVPDSEFSTKYGAFAANQVALGVPIEQIA